MGVYNKSDSDARKSGLFIILLFMTTLVISNNMFLYKIILNILKYNNLFYLWLIIIIFVFLIYFIYLKELYNNLCMYINISAYTHPRKVSEEVHYLSALLRSISRKGFVEYVVDPRHPSRGVLRIASRLNPKGLFLRLQNMHTILYSIGEDCNQNNKKNYEIIYFRNIEKIYNLCSKYKLFILFKKYNIVMSDGSLVIDLSNIIDINIKILLLEKEINNIIKRNNIEICIFLIDPVEYIENGYIEDICKLLYIKFKNNNIKINKCIVAVNASETLKKDI